MSRAETGIADVAVERLDVVPVRIEQVRRVVADVAVAVAGRAARAEARRDAGRVERIDLVARLRPEADVQIDGR